MSDRITLAEVGDFKYSIEIRPLERLLGQFGITIRSRWRSSRNPDEEISKFFTCVDRSGLERLASLIDTQLARRQA